MFYVLAVLIVLAAVAAVGAPSTRVVLLAVSAGDALVGVLLIASGAYLLGAVALVVPAVCLLALAWLLRRAGYAALLADVPGRAAGWPLAAAVCAGLGVLLLWVTATRVEDRTGSGAAGQSLLTVLHYRTPISLGVAVVLAVVAAGGALLIGRTGDDERVLDRAAEQRRLREQRARMRREHRAAARVAKDSGERQ